MLLKLRGDVEIKGKGRTTTYWVHGDAQGGTPPPASDLDAAWLLAGYAFRGNQ